MAALVFIFKSGDCLVLGATPELAASTYGLILNAPGDFVSLEGVGSLPKFALRKSEIVQMWLDPNDTTTGIASDALAHLQAAIVIRDLGHALLLRFHPSSDDAASNQATKPANETT